MTDKPHNPEPAQIEVAMNTIPFTGACPICQTKYRPDIGPALFVIDGGSTPICGPCTAKQPKPVLELLRRARRDSSAA